VSTLDDLTDSFTEAARDIVATSYGEGEDGWVAGIVRRASQVVSVRPVGEIEGDSAAALVARAESHLAEGDLAAAVAEIKALQGAAAEAAAPWLTKAEARLRVEAAMAQLTQLAIGRLAPKEG